MNAHATPLLSVDGQPDSSLGGLLAQLAPHEDKSLVLAYGSREVQPGYHVTEVKAGSFVTLDCGNNPDTWQETILQVEDIPAQDGQDFLNVGKFRAILSQVDRKIRLNADARVTIEIGRPDEAMRIYDVTTIDVMDGRVILNLGERPAICKPRHRAAQAEASACCSPSSASSSTSARCSPPDASTSKSICCA